MCFETQLLYFLTNRTIDFRCVLNDFMAHQHSTDHTSPKKNKTFERVNQLDNKVRIKCTVYPSTNNS